MDVSSDFHALRVAIHAPNEKQKKSLLYVFVTVDFRGDGTSQLIVKVVLRHLAE